MCGVSGPACWHDPLDDGLWERELPRSIRSPDTGWRLAAMNARTAPNIFVREGDGISTLVVEGDWTAMSIAGLSGHVLSPSNLSFRSEEHTSELQSLMRISYAVFCLKKKKHSTNR